MEFVTENISRFGYKPDAFYSHQMMFTDLIYLDDRQQVIRSVTENADKGIFEFQQHYRLVTGSGVPIWVDDYCRIHMADDGRTLHLQGIILDVTDRQKAQLHLSTSPTDLHGNTSSLAHIGHDLKTPLNAIMGFVQIMVNDPNLSDTQRNYLHLMDQNGQKLLQQINTIADLAKIDAGLLSLETSIIDLSEWLDDVSDSLRAISDTNNIDFNVQLDDHLPRYIRADSIRLRQILINLLVSVTDLAPCGQILFRIYSKDKKAGAGQTAHHISFEITHTVLNQFVEDKPPVDNALHQGSNYHTLGNKNDLNLILIRKLARMMGGTLDIVSPQDGVTTFLVDIRVPMANPVEISSNLCHRNPDERISGDDVPRRQAPLGMNSMATEVIDRLPIALMENLTKAIHSLDPIMIKSVIDNIRYHAPRLAQTLDQMADTYEYDNILRFIQRH